MKQQGFPGGAVVKNPPANAGDTGSSPVWEDPACRGATKPVHHNYWACALEPASHNFWSPRSTTTEACAPRACAPQQEKHCNEKPSHHNQEQPRSPQLEKARTQQRRPNTAKK